MCRLDYCNSLLLTSLMTYCSEYKPFKMPLISSDVLSYDMSMFSGVGKRNKWTTESPNVQHSNDPSDGPYCFIHSALIHLKTSIYGRTTSHEKSGAEMIFNWRTLMYRCLPTTIFLVLWPWPFIFDLLNKCNHLPSSMKYLQLFCRQNANRHMHTNRRTALRVLLTLDYRWREWW